MKTQPMLRIAIGMTTRQISETLNDIYGFEASEGFISNVTDKIIPQIEDWQNRSLSEVYPILYIGSHPWHKPGWLQRNPDHAFKELGTAHCAYLA